MKELVDINHAVPDTQMLLTKMEAMIKKVMTQSVPAPPPAIAAASVESVSSQFGKRFEDLSKQIKELHTHNQQMTQSVPANPPPIAAVSIESVSSQFEKRFEDLSKQITELHALNQQRSVNNASVAAFDQPPSAPPGFSQPRPW